MKIANTLYPKDTPVKRATLEDVRKVWPAMMPKDDSNQIAVWFPDMPWPTIVEKSQIVL